MVYTFTERTFGLGGDMTWTLRRHRVRDETAQDQGEGSFVSEVILEVRLGKCPLSNDYEARQCNYFVDLQTYRLASGCCSGPFGIRTVLHVLRTHE